MDGGVCQSRDSVRLGGMGMTGLNLPFVKLCSCGNSPDLLLFGKN